MQSDIEMLSIQAMEIPVADDNTMETALKYLKFIGRKAYE